MSHLALIDRLRQCTRRSALGPQARAEIRLGKRINSCMVGRKNAESVGVANGQLVQSSDPACALASGTELAIVADVRCYTNAYLSAMSTCIMATENS